MKEQSEENTKKEVIEKKTNPYIQRTSVYKAGKLILLLVLAVIAGIAGLRKDSGQRQSRRARRTRIGFENIGQTGHASGLRVRR